MISAEELKEQLACSPVIAAIREDKWTQALESPSTVLFYLDAHLLTVPERVAQAHTAGKTVFIHIDLAEGIGKDREGIHYLASIGADGIISTRASLIKMAKDAGLLTVQRFFLLDSRGVEGIYDMLRQTSPHFMELMPGVIPKMIQKFARGTTPVIAGGLLETKQEITSALSSDAVAVSTGCEKLWYL